ncbi:hypothetical protein [Oceanobacillus massiliensis]|uniref:hypothetical protein n=1 Tax=Oceanobacillus massiliensis TaxID=1465765 RepID=UPI000313C15C|nr:hypothetical protein [Oceanobacillus massiliensis]
MACVFSPVAFEKRLFSQNLLFLLKYINRDVPATADFRSGQSLSAGNASASSEETHFLRDLQLLLFPLESTALRSNQSQRNDI